MMLSENGQTETVPPEIADMVRLLMANNLQIRRLRTGVVMIDYGNGDARLRLLRVEHSERKLKKAA